MAVGSFVTAYFWWTVDWWHPATITHTRVGIEDLLLGFFVGGIMAGLFHVVFKKHLTKIRHRHAVAALVLIFAFLAGMSLLVHSGLSSFWASTDVMMVWVLLMLVDRPDLVRSSLLSGILAVLASLPAYLIAISFGHSMIRQVYDFAHLSGYAVIGIPIEEFVFWFLAGCVWGSFYEWCRGFRFVRDRA